MDGLLSPVSLPGGDSGAQTFNDPQSSLPFGLAHVAGDAMKIALAGQAATASYQAELYDGGAGRSYSHAAAIEQRIKDVKDATGQQLENPLNGGYAAEAEAALRAENPGAWLPPGDLDIQGKAFQIFSDKLDALQASGQYTAAQSLSGEAQDVANRAVTAAQKARDAAGPIGGALAGFAGGSAAMMRDPLQVAALGFGGGEAKIFTSVAGQLLETFARHAAVNAGLAAAAEPGSQSWRAERGQESGLLPALKEIGQAGLFGGVLGTAGHELARLIGHAPELGAAVDSARADRAAAEGAPGALAAGEARDMLTAGARRMEGEPRLPEPPPWTPENVPGERAEAALRAASPATAWDAADLLRGDLDLHQSALASADPEVRRAGQLASLSDPAYEFAQANLAPENAAHVAALVPEGQQASVAKNLARYAPQSEDEAHALISQNLDARAVPDAVAYMLGERPAPVSQPETLRAFLKRAGGVVDEGGDLKSMGLTRLAPGLINNKRGLPLDRAREIAAEAGYLGPHAERAMAETTTADLIEALREHPRYSIHDLGALEEQARRKAAADWVENEQAAGNRIDFHASRMGEKIDPEWRELAAKVLAEDPEMDPHDALERAAIVLYEQARDHAAAHADSPFPDEIDHETLEQADREAGYGGAGEGPDAGGEGDAAAARGEVRGAGPDGGEAGPGGEKPAGEEAKPLSVSPAELDGHSPDDLLARFPVETNGKVEMVSRADMGQAAERQAWLGQLIENCVL